MARKKIFKKREKLTALIIALILIIVLSVIIIRTGLKEKPGPTAAAVGNLSLIITGPPSACSFSLAKDWNFISFCADPANKSVASVMSPANGKYTIVLRWNEALQAYESYTVFGGGGEFNEISANRSYFVVMDTALPYFWVNGSNNTDMNISMVNGWNAPSWPYEFNTNVTNYLNPIAANYTFVLKWNSSSQSFVSYSVYAVDKPFTQIYIGEGQFIVISANNTVLVYNRTALQ